MMNEQTPPTKSQKRWAGLPENCCKALSGAIVIDRGNRHHSTLYLPCDAAAPAYLLLAKLFQHNRGDAIIDEAAVRADISSHEVWVYDVQRDESLAYAGLELKAKQAEPILAAIQIGKDTPRYGIRDGYVAHGEHSKKSDVEHIAHCLEHRARAAQKQAEQEQQADATDRDAGDKKWIPKHGTRGRFEHRR